MAFSFFPDEYQESLFSDAEVERLVSGSLTVNKAVLSAIAKKGNIAKADVQEVVLKVLKTYREKYAAAIDSGSGKRAAFAEATNEKALLIQRVKQAVRYQAQQKIKEVYVGERYVWLPSSAEVPDPLHQLNYGKTFTLGVGDANGEDPGDRYGCQCGMRVLTADEEPEMFDE